MLPFGIQKMVISNTSLSAKHIARLSKLQSLEHLVFKECTITLDIETVNLGDFQKLRKIELIDCSLSFQDLVLSGSSSTLREVTLDGEAFVSSRFFLPFSNGEILLTDKFTSLSKMKINFDSKQSLQSLASPARLMIDGSGSDNSVVEFELHYPTQSTGT